MPVAIRLEGSPERVDRRALGKDARALLKAVGLPRTEWSVVLADDAFVRPLNFQWRDKDTATDVLSFPQEVPTSPGRFALPPSWIGDVVISVETARRQADALGHSLDIELRVLLVHGLLHLLGYDHETGPEDAAEMAIEEARLLGSLGLTGSPSLVAR